MKKYILRLIERAGYVVTKIADQERRAHLVAGLQAELTRRAKRVIELENATRKLVEAGRDLRLGRERDARELEAARAETWQLKESVAELRRELDGLRQEQNEEGDLLKYAPPASVDQSVDGMR
jgi:hypothetical protein